MRIDNWEFDMTPPGANLCTPAEVERLNDAECAGPSGVPVLVQALVHPSYHLRMRALEALRRLGSEAAEAIPALIESSREKSNYPSFAAAAAQTLGRIGAIALPSILNEIQSEGGSELMDTALAAVGPQVIPALLDELDNTSPRVRRIVLSALHELAVVHPESINTLVVRSVIRFLGDSNPWVVSMAAIALGGMRVLPSEILSALKTSQLTHPNEPAISNALEELKSGLSAKDYQAAIMQDLLDSITKPIRKGEEFDR